MNDTSNNRKPRLRSRKGRLVPTRLVAGTAGKVCKTSSTLSCGAIQTILENACAGYPCQKIDESLRLACRQELTDQ